jgi:CPA2 family monovalent cation:H+ antiporter-2
MLTSILQLGFFLVLWFVVGIYLIPLFLKKAKSLMNDETLLVTSLALCFGMVVFASAVGFSAAFGAFVMGSILSETVEAQKIEHLVTPVKNLFGAIFFVSVGMMVDVNVIIEYIVPIICIIAAIMLGQTILSTCGFLLSGQSLKTAMKCSFSLTQIGEFAFILATLGTSLHVTSDFLYPIVVAVSVFTTFTTPYMIRLAEPAYAVAERVLPTKWIVWLESNATKDDEQETNEMQQLWRTELKKYILILLINSVLCVAIIGIMYYYGAQLIYGALPDPWSGIVTAMVTLTFCSPFLWSLMRQGGNSKNVNRLWYEGGNIERIRITALGILRLVIGAAFIAFIIGNTLPKLGMFGIFAVFVVASIILVSPNLEKQSNKMTKTFTENLNKREQQ